MVLFFNSEEKLDKVKKVLKELFVAVVKITDAKKQLPNIGRDLPFSVIADANLQLSETIRDLSFEMYSEVKRNYPNFTIQNGSLRDRPFPKNITIDEDTESLSDNQALVLNEFFTNNIEAFMELVSVYFLQSGTKRLQRNNQLFYCEVYSKYSAKKHELFIVRKKGGFYVLKENAFDAVLTDYLNDYFALLSNEDVESINQLSSNKNINYIECFKDVNDFFKTLNDKTKVLYDFKSGAITFLDFLAWKGLWQSDKDNNALNNVSKLIDSFKNKLNLLSRELFFEAPEIDLSSLISISDTIAIFTPKTKNVSEHKLLILHAKLAKHILKSCAEAKYPIRGAIAYGDYSIMNNIMIGPGIDECASWHEKGDWIGVHFTPTAEIYLNDVLGDNLNNDTIVEYSPPLKNGIKAKFCIKWNLDKKAYKDMALNTKALLPEISSKYTNTYAFFEEKGWQTGEEIGKK